MAAQDDWKFEVKFQHVIRQFDVWMPAFPNTAATSSPILDRYTTYNKPSRGGLMEFRPCVTGL